MMRKFPKHLYSHHTVKYHEKWEEYGDTPHLLTRTPDESNMIKPEMGYLKKTHTQRLKAHPLLNNLSIG